MFFTEQWMVRKKKIKRKKDCFKKRMCNTATRKASGKFTIRNTII